MSEVVTPGQATAISTNLNDRHLRPCPALALVILSWIEPIRMALLHPVTGTHIHPGPSQGTAQLLYDMSPLHQNGSELEARLLVGELAHFPSVAPPSANKGIDVSIARRREVGVGFQGAVRLGDDLLVGDETAVEKTAAGLVLRENGQGLLDVTEDLIYHPIDGLAHSAAMSIVTGILDAFLDRHHGIRCVLQIQGHHPSPSLTSMKQ